MRGWHMIVIVLIVYAVGAMYPGPIMALRAKLGM